MKLSASERVAFKSTDFAVPSQKAYFCMVAKRKAALNKPKLPDLCLSVTTPKLPVEGTRPLS